MAPKQTLHFNNYITDGKYPAGGYVDALGLNIRWQDGPLNSKSVTGSENGTHVETVIWAVIQRLEFLNTAMEGKFKSYWNDMAIESLKGALGYLDERTKEREERGVEGTHEP